MSKEKKFFEMTEAERLKDLEERVFQFNSLQLPGQPMGMHMGTSYLISDLWATLRKLIPDDHT